MTSTANRTLDYIPITGPGVDALERRKEHNNNTPVTAEKLRASIAKVREGLFAGLRMLTAGARERVKK